MEESTIHTVKIGHVHMVISAKEAAEIKPEHVKDWVFKHKPYSTGALITVGQLMQKSGLMNTQGVGHADALAAAEAKFIAQTVLTDWNQKTASGDNLPITAENIELLPPSVLAAFGIQLSRGTMPSKEEWDALKK